MRTPARRPRPASLLLPALAGLLAVSLTGCGGDDDTEPSASPTTSDTAPASESPTPSQAPSETSAAPTTDARPSACTLITEGDVAKATGLAVGPGTAEKGDDSDGGVSWATDECQFEAPGTAEVTVKVTGPGDVTAGTFGCPQPADDDGNVEPADDVPNATKGWWQVNSAPPLEATLRACSPGGNVDVDLDYDDGVNYDGDPREFTAQLAGFVLANLQG